MKRNHQNGKAGLFERNVATFGLFGDEAGTLEGANGLAAGDSCKARQTWTSTWVVSSSGMAGRSLLRDDFRYARIAWRTFLRAASTVLPWDMQPGS